MEPVWPTGFQPVDFFAADYKSAGRTGYKPVFLKAWRVIERVDRIPRVMLSNRRGHEFFRAPDRFFERQPTGETGRNRG